MIERLSPLARNIALALVFVLFGWFCWSVRSVLNPLILGYLLAFVLHPLVLQLEKLGWRRAKAVNVIFGTFALLLVLLSVAIFFQARSLVYEVTREGGLGTQVETKITRALEENKDEIGWLLSLLPHEAPAALEGEGGAEEASGTEPPPVGAQDLVEMVREAWEGWLASGGKADAQEIGLKAAGSVVAVVRNVFGGVLAVLGLLVLLPIYTYFLLFELERIHRFVQSYLPAQERDRIVRIGSQIGEVLANFFRGRLLVCLAKGSILALGLWVAGIDYALLLGLSTGFLSLIPFVGSLVGFLVTFLIGLVSHDPIGALWRVGLVFGVAEALENYVLIPKILGDSLGLHPVVVIFALMAGAASLGMFGLLIALPLAASLVILAREYLLPVLAQMAQPRRAEP